MNLDGMVDPKKIVKDNYRKHVQITKLCNYLYHHKEKFFRWTIYTILNMLELIQNI